MGFNFWITTTSVLERSEDTSWDVDVVHLGSCSSEKSIGEELSCFDGNWSKLELSINDITDGINVWNVSLLNIVDLEFSVLLTDDTSSSQVESSGKSISAHCEQNCLVLFSLLLTIIRVVSHLDHSTFKFFEFGWSGTFDKLGVGILHVSSDSFGHVLVESSEKD
jgi:hypothetical protein